MAAPKDFHTYGHQIWPSFKKVWMPSPVSLTFMGSMTGDHGCESRGNNEAWLIFKNKKNLNSIFLTIQSVQNKHTVLCVPYVQTGLKVTKSQKWGIDDGLEGETERLKNQPCLSRNLFDILRT